MTLDAAQLAELRARAVYGIELDASPEARKRWRWVVELLNEHAAQSAELASIEAAIPERVPADACTGRDYYGDENTEPLSIAQRVAILDEYEHVAKEDRDRARGWARRWHRLARALSARVRVWRVEAEGAWAIVADVRDAHLLTIGKLEAARERGEALEEEAARLYECNESATREANAAAVEVVAGWVDDDGRRQT